ncbi:fimbrial protein [Pseudomonas koreensis]|uniref:F4 family fimbrial subunit n=1 Tax=Pseudomonas koreensis TaxID=198620 RepID=UPI001B327F43|nr:fimbrial protein [Pseudomonas koreensis]MBP3996451.1 fimbrial protein [Pseudomonas koreensis]
MTRTGFLCLLLTCTASPAFAAILDQGELEFSGYVIDEAPRWLWQVASADQVWDVDVADARLDAQGNQVFSLPDKGSLAFLEGHLKKVADRGGAGMTPLISFSSEGTPLAPVAEGGSTQGPRLRTSVPVRNAHTGELVGQLSFTLEQGMVLAQGKALSPLEGGTDRKLGLSGMALVSSEGGQTGDVPPSLMSRLAVLMGMNNGVETAGIPLVWQGEHVSRQVLADSHVSLLAAAYASQLSNFTLSWPQDKVPSRWRASLSVTVTLR